MKNDFFLAFSELLEDKQLPKEVVVEALEAAMVSAYRKTVNASSAQQINAEFDIESGNVIIFAEKEVVDEGQGDRIDAPGDVCQPQLHGSAQPGDDHRQQEQEQRAHDVDGQDPEDGAERPLS